MDETLRQLGELLLGSIPTILLFVLLYAAYTLLVHRPLARTLAERRRRTEGAVEQARKDIGIAEARAAEYERRLREARLALFKRQEARQAEASRLRATAVEEARARSQVQVERARIAIEEEKALAHEKLEEVSGRLAAEIIDRILRPGEPVPAGQR